MRFCIEHVLVQNVYFGIGILQQIQILERFGQKETLHTVPRFSSRILHVAQSPLRILGAAVFLNRLKYFPTPLAVDWISRQLI